MAALWRDAAHASNQVIVDPTKPYVFKWAAFLEAGETQQAVEIKSKPAGLRIADTVLYMYDDPNLSTAWTLRYSATTASQEWSVPANTFPEGRHVFAVRIREGSSGDWTGWVRHKVDFDRFTARHNLEQAATAATLDPTFPEEAEYGVKVEVMSASGITGESTEQKFHAWQTGKYALIGGILNAVPEFRHDGTSVVRFKR